MTFRAAVERYLAAIAEVARRGDAREESYYGVLKDLFTELGPQVSNAHTGLTVLPRQTEAGNPDMRVWSGSQHITGYIECKQPEIVNLDRVEASDQLKRYRHAFPNVLLTNFLEFRLYPVLARQLLCCYQNFSALLYSDGRTPALALNLVPWLCPVRASKSIRMSPEPSAAMNLSIENSSSM